MKAFALIVRKQIYGKEGYKVKGVLFSYKDLCKRFRKAVFIRIYYVMDRAKGEIV